MIVQDKNQKMAIKGEIAIEFFNNRNMNYEPFLEPWIFKVSQYKIDNKNELKIQNYKFKEDKDLQFIMKDNKNSLNINVSTALIETAIEAQKMFLNKYQALSYVIVNKTGLDLGLKEV